MSIWESVTKNSYFYMIPFGEDEFGSDPRLPALNTGLTEYVACFMMKNWVVLIQK
jgi:hypothetical protein